MHDAPSVSASRLPLIGLVTESGDSGLDLRARPIAVAVVVAVTLPTTATPALASAVPAVVSYAFT